MTEEQAKYEVTDPKKEAINALINASSSLFFNVAKFEHAQRVAKVLMASTIVPEHFRNNVGNCIIALNYAERIQADPFMVMQNMYVVHGRPGLEAKLVIALINQSGKYSEPLKFKFDGSNEDYGCTAYTKETKSGQTVEGPKITAKIVKSEGWDKPKGTATSKWVTMPEVMYRYRAASWFANTNCPELKLGMSTVEEINDFIDVTPDKNGKYAVSKARDPEPTEPPDTSLFDKYVSEKKYIPEKLAEFIKKSADIQGKSEPEIKVMAQEHFEDFWGQFMAWQLKNAPKETEKKSKGKAKAEPEKASEGEMSPGLCPNKGKVVSVDVCFDCNQRPGCIIYPPSEMFPSDGFQP